MQSHGENQCTLWPLALVISQCHCDMKDCGVQELQYGMLSFKTRVDFCRFLLALDLWSLQGIKRRCVNRILLPILSAQSTIYAPIQGH